MTTSTMAKEAAQTPTVIANQLNENQILCEQLAEKLGVYKPSMVYIIGRGSSDHAGVFGKYLIEIEVNIPVCAAAPSVSSVYQQNLKLDGALVLIISQSGRSPDILAQAKAARSSGAFCVALVNDESSPLTDIVDAVLPLRAGKELAVAATKSYLATLSALLHMVAVWHQDQALLKALRSLPALLEHAIAAPAQLDVDFVKPLAHCVVLGRGFGYAIAREMALKLKEVCGVHAEAFSSAEFLHGPVTLVAKKLALMDVSVEDESLEQHQQQMAEVRRRGANVVQLFCTQPEVHPRLAPLMILQRFYLDIEQVARQMGLNPDQPAGLLKVTKTR